MNLLNMNPQELQEIVTLLKDIITSLAALTAAIVAVLGLKAWKKQLKGKTEYEMAKSLLEAVYKLKREIEIARNFMVLAGEIQAALKTMEVEGTVLVPKTQANGLAAVYMTRSNRVRDKLTQLDLTLVEAETLWGAKVRQALKPFQFCAYELVLNHDYYIDHLIKSPDTAYEDIPEGARQIISDIPETENPFTNKIALAVEQGENYLKPHLRL